jgi:hypothetical protein
MLITKTHPTVMCVQNWVKNKTHKHPNIPKTMEYSTYNNELLNSGSFNNNQTQECNSQC